MCGIMNKEGRISLFNPNALNSMEFTGYDLTMAVAELIDNSLDEDATDIKLAMTVSKTLVKTRSTDSVIKFAVIDNGNGMTPEVLQKALTVGGSTHSIASFRGKKKTIGKFGMGLPQASLNMARVVHVWSWQDGYQTAKHAFIDRTVNDEEPGVDFPDDLPVPSEYVQFIKDYKSGTIVVWSDLINTGFARKPITIYNDIRVKVGRMYRYYLHEGSCKISVVSLDLSGKCSDEPKYFKPVDPLFLMPDGDNGCVNDKVPITPMFEEHCDPVTYNFKVDPNDDAEYPITIKFSMAKKQVWPGDENDTKDPGRYEYGKFAAQQIGVSIVRSKRELEFIDDWHCPDTDDSRNRWWGVEIDFDPAFDSIFGVDNRKQNAKLFHEYAVKSKTRIFNEFDLKEETASSDLDSLKESNPNVYILLTVILKVDRVIAEMMNQINQARAKATTKKPKRYKDIPSNNPEKYDAVAEERGKNTNTQSTTDKIIQDNPGERSSGVQDALNQDSSYQPESVENIMNDVKDHHRISVDRTVLDSSALFGVDRKHSQMILRLNIEHPLYQKIFGIYDDCISNSTEGDPMILMQKAYDSIILMLEGWVRMEDEALDPKEKAFYRSIRENWGRILFELESHDTDN